VTTTAKPDLSFLPLLALAGFASGAGMRVLDPVLPLIAADFGVSVSAAASMIAGFSLAYGAGQLVTGPLGDRWGKLRVACLALLVFGVGIATCAAAWDLVSMVALRTVTGLVAGAIIPLAIAWIGDAVPYEDRQATIGKFLTGMVMAQLLAGPVSGAIAEFAGWRVSFLVLALLALGTGSAFALRIGPAGWRAGPSPGARGLGLGKYMELLKKPAGRRLMVAGFVDGFALFGGAFPFVGAFLIQTFGLSAATAGLVVAGFGAGAFAYTRFAGRMVKAAGERGLVLIGGALLAAMLLTFALAPDWHLIVPAQLVCGFGFYMFHGVLQARATEALPDARATAVSAFAMALFLGQSVGALVFGTVLHAAGYGAVFTGAAAVTAALAAWVALTPGR
jgi:predicted MFS family arabinose efflux permease